MKVCAKAQAVIGGLGQRQQLFARHQIDLVQHQDFLVLDGRELGRGSRRPPRRSRPWRRAARRRDRRRAPRSRRSTPWRGRAVASAEKMPGVSTRMICALFSITMPRISARVVCTLRETIVTLEPTSALTSVDLPTLGAPISATKPQRVAAGAASSASFIRHCCRRRRLRARSSTEAATFSAARLLPPTPSAGSSPGKSTATRNCGS